MNRASSRLPRGFALAALTLGAAPALAAVAAPGGSSAPSRASSASCREHVDEGKRPTLKESLPDKGLSGYALVLEITVEHDKGETVLPSGFSLQRSSAEARALEAAFFHVPDPAGPVAPALEAHPDGTSTRVRIPFVPLPPKPGRQELTLPPVPIAVARQNGTVITLCTTPHVVSIEDPIANEPDPRPKANPEPLRQLEEWTTLKHVAAGALAALVAAVIGGYLLSRWLRRPRPAPPPPPPRPPWEVALEELFDLRNAALIQQGRLAVHFERASHIVRKYLGGRYGFDGLETTTQEMIAHLHRAPPPAQTLAQIEAFLHKADLVKFAKLTPTEAECEVALERAEEIVRKTVPAPGKPAEAKEPETAGGAA